MTNLEKWLERACEAVGLKVDFSFKVVCPNSQEVDTVARIRDIGGVSGMLIVTDYDSIRDHLDCLRSLGYGFSVLSEPSDKEEFDIQSAKETFIDWGWDDGRDSTARP